MNRFIAGLALLAALTVFAFVAGTSVEAQQVPNSAKDQVVGTWRLVSWMEQETETKAVHKLFGDNPLGLLTYTADGRMMVIFTDPNRKAAATRQPTEAEAAHLFKTMVAYAGTYSVEGNKVIHKIEVSSNQAWNGTSQQRLFETKDNRLFLKTPPFMSAFLGKEIISELVWERTK